MPYKIINGKEYRLEIRTKRKDQAVKEFKKLKKKYKSVRIIKSHPTGYYLIFTR